MITLQEAINEITSVPKWYAGKLKQSTASMTVKAILEGNAKPKTVKAFMAKFGYEVEREMLWRKNESN
jgi:hypothetical protein